MSDGHFYVYLHRRATDGSVFYVGKGSGSRAYVSYNRSEWWNRVVNKHGKVVEYCQTGMCADDAYLLEMWLISKLKNEGETLVNMTDGGDGWDACKASYVPSHNSQRKPIYCSNGMRFESQYSACKWLSKDGVKIPASINISKCARGKISSAYGYAWSYDSVPDQPAHTGQEAKGWFAAERLKRKVLCEEMNCCFRSLGDAAEYLRGNGFEKATHRNISLVCLGKRNLAYGCKWRYIDS